MLRKQWTSTRAAPRSISLVVQRRRTRCGKVTGARLALGENHRVTVRTSDYLDRTLAGSVSLSPGIGARAANPYRFNSSLMAVHVIRQRTKPDRDSYLAKSSANFLAPGNLLSSSITTFVAAISFETTLLRMAIGLRSYPADWKKFAVGTRSRHSNGINNISIPLPSPVRFIISSSAAVNDVVYPIFRANMMESKSFCVWSM